LLDFLQISQAGKTGEYKIRPYGQKGAKLGCWTFYKSTPTVKEGRGEPRVRPFSVTFNIVPTLERGNDVKAIYLPALARVTSARTRSSEVPPVALRALTEASRVMEAKMSSSIRMEKSCHSASESSGISISFSMQ
jgi:hypothetical protein